jgi:hypothetical protein
MIDELNARNKVVDCSEYGEEAADLFLNDSELIGNKSAVARYIHQRDGLEPYITVKTFRKRLNTQILKNLVDRDLVIDNVKLAKSKQKYQDINRIERKSFRSQARIENAVTQYAKELSGQFKLYAKELKKLNITPLKRRTTTSGVGVLQISDPHFNELIDLPNNRYDFKIGAKRLKLHVNKSLDLFDSEKVKEVVIMITGDLLNSDRRLDELLNQATNRSKASLLVQHLLLQAILDVRNRGYKISIVSVLGNESRVNKEMTFSDMGLSDNYDFTIVAGVKKILQFSKIKGITWGSIDKVETIVEIEGLNWLVSHDVSRYTSNQHKNQSAVGRFSQNGIKIDYTIGGHIHYTNVGVNFARSSSLAGSNSYNEIALNLGSRAQQMCYITRNGYIQPIVIDVQNADHIEGYDIVEELEAYNAKSLSKTIPEQVIFKVVI